jgi:hypothetical protein
LIITYIHSNRVEDRLRVQLRCRNFADAINRMRTSRANLLELNAFTQNTPEAQRMCAESDLLVIYRYLYGPILTAIQYWKAREKKIIVDFDQAINYLTPEMPEYSFWWQGVSLVASDHEKSLENLFDSIPLEQFKWGLGMVDAATVASARLADDWSQFTPVYELPDYLNTNQYPLVEKAHENEIWLGLGQAIQLISFKNSGLGDAVEAICREFPQVKLVLSDLEKFSGLGLSIDPRQIVVYPPYFFDEWVKILLKLDLGLVPISGDYDLRQSQASLLEFMTAKIPWIATEQLPFHHLSQFGICTKNSPEAWKSALVEMINRLSIYQKKATREPFLFALGQDLNANIEKVLKIYAAIIN